MYKRFLLLSLIVVGCVRIPDNVVAIDGFDINRYVGTWYEIARLDHRFERGLSNVTATYTLRDDGGIDVINKGFNEKTGKWEQARGKAYFVSDADIGRLKVSFFGPFYGGYNIIALDKQNYSYSLVCGPNRSYLWILAREKQLSQGTLENLVNFANVAGFETDALIYVEHNAIEPGDKI